MSVAGTYNNMGNVYESLGDYEKALFHFQNALDIKIKSLGGAHVSVADTKTNIGIVHGTRGNQGTAKQYYRRLMAST